MLWVGTYKSYTVGAYVMGGYLQELHSMCLCYGCSGGSRRVLVVSIETLGYNKYFKCKQIE